ncbi:hypothetical protein ACEQ8H_007430 [Pleosporales sp. CAS-2024a]
MARVPVPQDNASLLHIERISQYVSLSPASLNHALPALCASIFSPLLLSYFAPARGIVLAYENVLLSSRVPSPCASETNTAPEPLVLKHIDEYTTPFLWATASFLVFRPRRHASISARITHQSKTHITLSYLNTFPVSVTRDYLPDQWSWHQTCSGLVKKGWDGRLSDEGGHWVDREGAKVEGELEVRIRDWDGRMDARGRGKGFLRIEGTMLKEGDGDARHHKRRRRDQKGKGQANGGEVVVVE